MVQAQVLSQKEAAKRLANARHSREATLPVMFFGTLEIGWLQVTPSMRFLRRWHLQSAHHLPRAWQQTP